MSNADTPTHDPLSDGAADLVAGMNRAKAAFVEMGVEFTTADLIAGAKIILDAYPPTAFDAIPGIAEHLEKIADSLRMRT
jgi:hypothetical protein